MAGFTVASTARIANAGAWAGFASVASGSAIYFLTQNTSTGKLSVWKTTNGTSVTEQDSANAVTNNSATAPFCAAENLSSGGIWYISYFTGTNTIRVRGFDTTDDTWDASDTGGDISTGAHNALPMNLALRSDGDIVQQRTNNSGTNVGWHVWEGSTWTSISGWGGTTTPYSNDLTMDNNDRCWSIVADNQNNDASYKSLASDNTTGTQTDFDNTVHTTAKVRLAGAVFFNDGTTNRIAASQRDTGGEIDVYHGDTGGTTLTNTTTLDAVTGTSPQTTSTDLIYKNFGSGNRLGLIWSEANVVKYRITNQASPAFTWATEVALLSGLTDTDVCPQWVTGFGGIGALYQDNGSVKVEWVVSPSFGGGGGFAFSQAVIIA